MTARVLESWTAFLSLGTQQLPENTKPTAAKTTVLAWCRLIDSSKCVLPALVERGAEDRGMSLPSAHPSPMDIFQLSAMPSCRRLFSDGSSPSRVCLYPDAPPATMSLHDTYAHRGYAERSRRARVWDPSSAVYAEGASERHAASPASCNVESNEERDRGGTFAIPGARASTRDCQREKRNRRNCVGADADHPVEMDWKEVKRIFRGFQADWVRPPVFIPSCFRNVSLCFIIVCSPLRNFFSGISMSSSFRL